MASYETSTGHTAANTDGHHVTFWRGSVDLMPLGAPRLTVAEFLEIADWLRKLPRAPRRAETEAQRASV